jgi:predicted nucleic acid-binding protein
MTELSAGLTHKQNRLRPVPSLKGRTLLRVHMKVAQDTSAAAAWSVLEAIHSMPDHVFWNDGFSYREVSFASLAGSKQVTDAWLAELARRQGAQLATLDDALASLHSDVAFLVPNN